MTTEIDELVESVISIRDEQFPNISDALVRRILEIEAAFVDDRPEASKRISRLVEEFLAEDTSS
jgi:hypothetical protein